jgi:hypothetical protein
MTKRSLAIVTLVILALAVPASMLAQQSKAEKEVRSTLEQFRQANLTGGAEGAAILEQLLADDYARIFNDGSVYVKAQTLENLRAGKTKYQSFEFSDLKIRVYGNTAVATAFVKTSGSTYGVATSPTGVRWTQFLVKRNGKWQPVLLQTTMLAPASAQASQDAPPSYVADPVYTLLSENDQFRVIMAKRPVGHRDAWHSHLPQASYNLTECPSRAYLPDGTAQDFALKAGAVQLVPAIPSHALENIGTAECDQLIVERK